MQSQRDLECALEAAQDRLAAARASISRWQAEDAALVEKFPRLVREYGRLTTWPQVAATHSAERGRIAAWLADARELERRELAAVERCRATLAAFLAPPPADPAAELAALRVELAELRSATAPTGRFRRAR